MPAPVIASDEAIQLSLASPWIASLALATTAKLAVASPRQHRSNTVQIHLPTVKRFHSAE
jgi:hypothetical protein